MPWRISARRLAAVGFFLAAGFGLPSAQAGDGFYAKVALERGHVAVNYRKSVGFDSPPSYALAEDRERS